MELPVTLNITIVLHLNYHPQTMGCGDSEKYDLDHAKSHYYLDVIGTIQERTVKD